MDYAVVGGDARFAYLTRMLMSAGWDARAVDGDSSEVPGVPCAGADALDVYKRQPALRTRAPSRTGAGAALRRSRSPRGR